MLKLGGVRIRALVNKDLSFVFQPPEDERQILSEIWQRRLVI